MKQAKRQYRFKKSDEFWLIIDRDDWEEIHNHDFSKLVEDCKKEENFFMAMSNPCFELWLVLHLIDLENLDDNQKSKLFENKKVNKNKNYIDDFLGELQGRGYNKRPNPSIFLPTTRLALQRAKALDNLKEDYPKSLGTHVYKLIEKLMT